MSAAPASPSDSSAPPPTSTWRFPGAFWIANVIELFERAAWYGTLIALALYLTSVVGFSDVAAGWIGAIFTSLVYLFPFLTGALADRIGFRAGLLIAFALLALGYGILGLLPLKPVVIAALPLVALGGAFVKPIITGTVAKTTDGANRARGFSLFYMMVNVGSFSGKTVAKPVRVLLGLRWIPLYSSAIAAFALLLTALFYRPPGRAASEGASSTARPSLRGLLQVTRNGRFLALILITAGFWAIQGQLYASMPKYVLRTVGEGASPEWYANVNPLVVVLLVVPITWLVRKLKPVASIAIALALVPCSALIMTLSTRLGPGVSLFGMTVHPVTLVMVAGIALQGLAECFLSPRWLEYASKQAPPGAEGLYLGYAHLNTFFAWLFGFILSGYLLDAFCPDPARMPAPIRAAHAAALAGKGPMPAAWAHAHYLWYAFAGIGATAFVALVVFMIVTRRREAKNE